MSIAIFILTILMLLVFTIKKPKIWNIDSYIIVSVIGAIIMLGFKQVSFVQLKDVFFSDHLANPLKIVILFLSMTFLSVVLDQLGFFQSIANYCAKKANNQITLFCIFYLLISILTIFTSNDIVILTFTPFLCYFCKKANVNPIPYLIAEFVAANSWSMLLSIGNPTNILLSLTFEIDFISYFFVMVLPTIAAGITSFMLLLLLFWRPLHKPITRTTTESLPLQKSLTFVSLAHLGICITLLVLSNYIHLEMYLITFTLACSLILILLLYQLRNHNHQYLQQSLKSLPYGILPFLVSMFIMVSALHQQGVTVAISNYLTNLFSYGVSSFLFANFMNNIPMTVLYANVLQTQPNLSHIYAVIISSNLGALLTPFGSLAGLMWLTLLKKQNVDFSFLKFITYGCLISIPTLLITLGVLMLVL